ncbi:flagellar motor switch protein FliG [Gimesia maris]|jgi:flagellar motor switch protein FliG|uniref:Flagellar motor switch protein FliG n=1 Tax=Gimesia maris TaxID=122 RepID=A0A3D3RBQ1_9PLAN|nr:flagellar motor switch protein FliG [Gimesia maris]MAC51361.1 flagellar motor switch protein FliG [Gimesia sp.]HAW28695.1 flagellar motor switch protein FliG [Planctomycetaceae bacterium]EDL56806.1 flagellar motor switch protein fliG [Gimesia maris DSM 8797]QDT78750.1 Flagellar motor switch protein FliG [Gimesia maris]QDU14283.1 Flagellar motor switch protein FliG [Gimesia maris]|tara:strand:+ start:75974 stop:76969 length:996 start_codon:yes stop_codon:yes gene_type:complete
MDELQKAAVLLLSLDKALAAEVLSLMSKEDVEKVTMMIARMQDVSKEQQATVLSEFTNLRGEQTTMERGGLAAVNELLEQSLGKEGAGSILDSINQTMNSVPFGFLQKSGANNLLTFIIEEHPQTIAMIMSHLPSNMAAEVLAGLPSNKQMDVIKRIANMEQTSPEVIRDVEKSLEHRMKNTFSQGMEKAGGVELVAEILNVTDRMTNKGILESMDQETPDLADEIRRLMFVFDDLVKLDNKAIQALLKEVDTNQWAVALKGASEEIKQKVLSNLSQRAADMLREEMEYLGPIKVSDVEAVQQQIVDSVRRLEDAGEIEVAAGNESEQYIT